MPDRYNIIGQRLVPHPQQWLITGVAGFIGSNLLEALLEPDQTVVGLDNFSTGYQRNLDEVRSLVSPEQWKRFRFIEGDIRRMEDCVNAFKGVDHVLHEAALGSVPRSVNDPIATHEINISGFLNMLVAARDAEVASFTYAASSSTYGDHPGLPKVDDRIGQPLSPYAVTKYANELYASVFARTYGFKTIGLRYFNVFGKRLGQHARLCPPGGDLARALRACQPYPRAAQLLPHFAAVAAHVSRDRRVHDRPVHHEPRHSARSVLRGGSGRRCDRHARLCEPRYRIARQHGRSRDQPGHLAGAIGAIECGRSRSGPEHRAKVVVPDAGDWRRRRGGDVAPRADGRGAFDAANTAAVSSLVRWGAVQLPFYFSVLVLVQLFASEGRFKAMAIIAAANFAVKAIANFVLIQWLGIAGVMLAASVVGASAFGCYLLLTLSNGSSKNKASPL